MYSTNFLVHCVAENEAKVLSLNSGQDLTQTGALQEDFCPACMGE